MSDHPSPEKIMQIATGGWAAGVLGAACHHALFDVLEGEGATATQVAQRAAIAPRGAQALLDGCVGLGLCTVEDGTYRNSPEASAFLVSSTKAYLGGFPEVMVTDFARWADVFQVAKTGAPTTANEEIADNPFWEKLVPAIAAMSVPVAERAAAELQIAEAGACRWLDVGGGSGIYSAIWLGKNPQAKGVQLDWATVNRVARDFVGRFGVADRFETIDGDFRTTDFGTDCYDFAVYSHIAHQESPASNLALFRKFRQALKPGGTLAINDFVVNNDRTGPPMPLLFAANMLVFTAEGTTYRTADYEGWLAEAGFASVRQVEPDGPSSLILAS